MNKVLRNPMAGMESLLSGGIAPVCGSGALGRIEQLAGVPRLTVAQSKDLVELTATFCAAAPILRRFSLCGFRKLH